MSEATDERKAKSLAQLQRLIKPNDTIYLIQRGRNTEGRIVDCYVFEIVPQTIENEPRHSIEPIWVTRHIANVTEEPYVENDPVSGLLIAGTGFRLEDQIADLLKVRLFPNSTVTLYVKTL